MFQHVPDNMSSLYSYRKRRKTIRFYLSFHSYYCYHPLVPYLHQAHSHFLMALFCQSVSKVGYHHSAVSRVSITWLIKLWRAVGGWGAKSTMVIRNFNLRKSPRRNRVENWLELVFNIHTPLFPTVNSVAKTQLFLGIKKVIKVFYLPTDAQ